eukprot:CAMPEP_0201661216 /NCGR_PEP_ID=MMETSP0494-20130426/3638_1 /ASSEMBLY_ACC=CAM_ASM_000839 /TAXON_ID=420259 /ORGANISM="Thalassiosira gravida, Strain GMp14c1" /LENGTH=312 /DNA_ID=CAMNT_0048139265 /DNA_START=203 /DNA_END=1141 /DNA_ORIENTATION=-
MSSPSSPSSPSPSLPTASASTNRRRCSSRHHARLSRTTRLSSSFVIVLLAFVIAGSSIVSWNGNTNINEASSSSKSLSSTSLFVASASARGVTPSSSSSSSSSPAGTTKGLITLNAKNFDLSLRDGKVWLIEFYAPWCGHCTRFATTYESVATHFHYKQLDRTVSRQVNVAKIDGASERALASRFGVTGFPIFFLVDGWTVREYDGVRSFDGLVKFATATENNNGNNGDINNNDDLPDPVPFLFGPFGPMGQLKGSLMRGGTWAVGMYEDLTLRRGMKPLVAMATLCVGGLVVGLVAIIVVGLAFLPKAKQD